MILAKRWISKGYESSLVLRFVGLASSTYHTVMNKKKPEADSQESVSRRGRKPTEYSYTTTGDPICNAQIKEWLCELIAGDGFPYGYKKLTTCLQEEYNLIINHKKVYRLCKELGILRKQRPARPKPRNVANKPAKVTDSDELWEMDIKYGRIDERGKFFFQLSLIDVYDRSVIDYHLGLSCKSTDAIRVLKTALAKRSPESMPVIRTDNGPQFTAKAFMKACDKLRIEHELIPPRTPNLNAHIEAFHSILADDCYDRHEFQDFAHVYQVVTDYMNYYNTRRRHGSLGNQPPERYYENNRSTVLAAA